MNGISGKIREQSRWLNRSVLPRDSTESVTMGATPTPQLWYDSGDDPIRAVPMQGDRSWGWGWGVNRKWHECQWEKTIPRGLECYKGGQGLSRKVPGSLSTRHDGWALRMEDGAVTSVLLKFFSPNPHPAPLNTGCWRQTCSKVTSG
jgi:hypothetical protein